MYSLLTKSLLILLLKEASLTLYTLAFILTLLWQETIAILSKEEASSINKDKNNQKENQEETKKKINLDEVYKFDIDRDNREF